MSGLSPLKEADRVVLTSPYYVNRKGDCDLDTSVNTLKVGEVDGAIGIVGSVSTSGETICVYWEKNPYTLRCNAACVTLEKELAASQEDLDAAISSITDTYRKLMSNPNDPDQAECQHCYDSGHVPGSDALCRFCLGPEEPPRPPSLLSFEQSIQVAIERGYQHGDVNHLVQPIIGMLRVRERDNKPLQVGDLAYVIERLSQATQAETALLAYLHPEKYGL